MSADQIAAPSNLAALADAFDEALSHFAEESNRHGDVTVHAFRPHPVEKLYRWRGAARDLRRAITPCTGSSESCPLPFAHRCSPAAEVPTPPPVAYDQHGRVVMDQIAEADRAAEWADKLAAALAPSTVVGEHSSMNDPWANALAYAGGPWGSPDARYGPASPPAEGEVASDDREALIDGALHRLRELPGIEDAPRRRVVFETVAHVLAAFRDASPAVEVVEPDSGPHSEGSGALACWHAGGQDRVWATHDGRVKAMTIEASSRGVGYPRDPERFARAILSAHLYRAPEVECPLAVGDTVTTAEQLDRLSVGTVLSARGALVVAWKRQSGWSTSAGDFNLLPPMLIVSYPTLRVLDLPEAGDPS